MTRRWRWCWACSTRSTACGAKCAGCAMRSRRSRQKSAKRSARHCRRDGSVHRVYACGRRAGAFPEAAMPTEAETASGRVSFAFYLQARLVLDLITLRGARMADENKYPGAYPQLVTKIIASYV